MHAWVGGRCLPVLIHRNICHCHCNSWLKDTEESHGKPAATGRNQRKEVALFRHALLCLSTPVQ